MPGQKAHRIIDSERQLPISSQISKHWRIIPLVNWVLSSDKSSESVVASASQVMTSPPQKISTTVSPELSAQIYEETTDQLLKKKPSKK